MKVYNKIDEKGRMKELPEFHYNGNGQYDSHTFSYVGARNMYKEIENNMPIGLELKLLKNEAMKNNKT